MSTKDLSGYQMCKIKGSNGKRKHVYIMYMYVETFTNIYKHVHYSVQIRVWIQVHMCIRSISKVRSILNANLPAR